LAAKFADEAPNWGGDSASKPIWPAEAPGSDREDNDPQTGQARKATDTKWAKIGGEGKLVGYFVGKYG